MKMRVYEFGETILRQRSRALTHAEIISKDTQQLVVDMRDLLLRYNAGVAIAAPQVGIDAQVVVVAVRPTEHRPQVENFDLVMINPEITETFGKRGQIWEGCLSTGGNGLFGKTLRYRKVKVKYYDEAGAVHTQTFDGLMAQIAQHEVDHLNGLLFVDRVKDSRTYVTKKQYIRMLKTDTTGTMGTT